MHTHRKWQYCNYVIAFSGKSSAFISWCHVGVQYPIELRFHNVERECSLVTGNFVFFFECLKLSLLTSLPDYTAWIVTHLQYSMQNHIGTVGTYYLLFSNVVLHALSGSRRMFHLSVFACECMHVSVHGVAALFE